MKRFDLIAFDADDTLWHNENLYTAAQEHFFTLLAKYRSREEVEPGLYSTEMRNLATFGYGIKGFTLSMIETAIEMTGGEVTGKEIQQIIDLARGMMANETQVLAGVRDTVAELAREYPLMIITKGDMFDQETKLARSGLGEYFRYFEILSDKTRERYELVLQRLGIDPARLLMVGNSLRSDIQPVVELGGTAVYIPYETTWAHEVVAVDEGRYHQLESMAALPGLVARLEAE